MTLALFIIRAANTICFFIITWYLGERQAGIYALALNYALFFSQLAFWGLDNLLAREISVQKVNIDSTISFFLLVRSVATGVCYLLLLVFILFVQQYTG